MDWLNRMNKAVDYIESNLADEISYDKAAQVACCSAYHFQRMFSFITDVPLSEYIRRRRLTLAAFELQTSDIKVVDVALKYGYESPEAFSRVFKNLHGVMPVSARDIGVALKAFPNRYDDIVSPEYTTLSIPKQTWAIFQTEWKSEHDDEKLHEIWRRIYSEWFPVASYEHADCDFDMEMYFGCGEIGYSAEIWIPVVRK